MPGPATPRFLLVTCEHGGNHVPGAFRDLFRGRQALLASHRGWDAGALQVGRDLARRFAAPLVYSRTSRLLVDLNRSPGHPRLFSPLTRPLPAAQRVAIFAGHYLPYRAEVQRRVADALARGRAVVHISSHSFVPVLDGVRRDADVGLLYDPRRAGERELARRWRAALSHLRPDLRVRCNYPYAGRADGLTSHLRRLHPASRYAGIELEVNQRHVRAGGREWTRLRHALAESLALALG